MASNDDNPPPPPELTFEEYKKTVKMDYHKPQETNEFIKRISPFKVDNIIDVLRRCVLITPNGSEDEREEEGEAESPQDEDAELKDLLEHVEIALKKLENKVISPQKQSTEIENLPSCNNNDKIPDGLSAFLVAYSSSPSPTVGSPDGSSNFSRKTAISCRRTGSGKSSGELTPSSSEHSHGRRASPPARSSHHRSSPPSSPEHSHGRRASPPARSSHHRSSKSRPRVRSSSRSHRRSRRHRSYDSRSRSPEDIYYRRKEEDRCKRRKSHRSPIPEKSSSSRSPGVEDIPKKKLKKEKSVKSSFSTKFSKFPVDPEDEFTTLLSQEMKRTHLIPDSDEERDARVGKNTNVKPRSEADSTKKYSDEAVEALPEDQTSLIKYELGMVAASEKTSDVKFPQEKFFKDVKVKTEFIDKKVNVFNNFFCELCQLSLNSQLTWESHISGKKHAKQMKLQTVHEIAKGSLAVPATPGIVSEDVPRFANAPLGRKRLRVSQVPRLQQTIDETRDRPIPGLDYVQEIISTMDVDYYCELCDAPCKSSSIMPHLVGQKHHLKALRKIDPIYYERNKSRNGRPFKSEVQAILEQYEKRRGRGSIKVFIETDDPHTRPAYDQPGPSWRNPSLPSVKQEGNIGQSESGVTKDVWLDMSKGDFFCTLCDSHMNNVQMWKAHVIGKRHLANAKKIPGENISKMKSERLHGATSKLESMIDEELMGELVVGLDFIRETRGSQGEIYNCFLCGSCSTNYDILEHILLMKHRTKYLEKLHNEGKENSIKQIDQLELKDMNYRESLINDECYRMIAQYGRGRVEVYKSKT